jgi:hypothetical protein
MGRKFARGIKLSNGMNRLENSYAEHLDSLVAAGDIIWYAFEPIRLKLAEKTYYCPDFLVCTANYELQVHEVKGYWHDDARVKIKVAAKLFPFRFIAITQRPKKRGGGWEIEEFTKDDRREEDASFSRGARPPRNSPE